MSAIELDDNVAAIDKDGSIFVWNRFNGDLASKSYNLGLKDASLTKQYAILAREDCIHVFKR